MILFVLIFLLRVEASEYTTRISVRTDNATLSNDYAPWRSQTARIGVTKKRDHGFALFEEHLQRYDLGDKRNGVSAWVNLLNRLNWSGEYTRAAEGVIIPRTAATNRLGVTLFNGWQIATSRTDSEYETGAASTITTSGIVTYTGPFRLAYTRYHANVKNAGDADSDKFAVHYFYDGSFTAAAYSKGRELEALPNKRVLDLDVLTFALFGEYRLSDRWAVEYSYEYVEQDTLYIRNGVGFGAVYSF